MTIASGQFGYDSAALGQRDRFDAYRQLYAPGADVAAIGDDFRVTMTGWRLDRALLYDRRLSGVAHERDDGRVRRDAMEHFTLTLVVAGEFHADGGEGFRRVRPGEVLLMDMTRPARNRAPSAHIVTMSMARERVARLAPSPRRLHGEVLAIEPERMLSYTWDHVHDDPAFDLRSVVTFTLTPTAAGTHLRVEQTGFRPTQRQAFGGARAGWQQFLARLEEVAGRL